MADANTLVRVYIKMRTAKEKMVERHEAELSALTVQMDAVSQALLDICKATGQDGGKTESGTFSRTVKTRYWTSNWPAMYKVIKEHDMPQLLEQRVHQGNFKEYLKSNPEGMPEGMNVESKYAVTVTRPRAKLS